MIIGKNGFGNDSYCVLLTHANGETINTYEGDIPNATGYFMESSNGGEQHECILMNNVGKTSISVFGGQSWDVTGSTEWRYITCTGNTGGDDWNMGRNDFCIDFRIYIINLNGTEFFGSNGVYQDDRNFWGFAYDNGEITTNDGLMFIVRVGGNNTLLLQWDTIPGDITLNRWHHCALTRSGNVFRLYWDGYMKATITNTNFTMPNFNEPYLIGSTIKEGGDFISGKSYKSMNAYYDEFRISKGISRWTSNFILPNREY